MRPATTSTVWSIPVSRRVCRSSGRPHSGPRSPLWASGGGGGAPATGTLPSPALPRHPRLTRARPQLLDPCESPVPLNLSSDQEFLRDTTTKFLADRASVAELRRLRDDPTGFDPAYWRQGAELGWTSLLVSEERGGGSISGDGLIDLTLIAHEFGRHAAPGPLATANIVAAALSNDPVNDHNALLETLLAGTSIASWCHSEPRP